MKWTLFIQMYFLLTERLCIHNWIEFQENKKLFFFLIELVQYMTDFLIFRPVHLNVQIALREFCEMCAVIRFEAKKKQQKFFLFFSSNFCERLYGGDLCCTIINAFETKCSYSIYYMLYYCAWHREFLYHSRYTLYSWYE